MIITQNGIGIVIDQNTRSLVITHYCIFKNVRIAVIIGLNPVFTIDLDSVPIDQGIGSRANINSPISIANINILNCIVAAIQIDSFVIIVAIGRLNNTIFDSQIMTIDTSGLSPKY